MKKKKITVNKILSYCILVIILVIVFGTFIYFVGNLFKDENSSEKKDEQPILLNADSFEIYKKIGRIRTSTKDEIPIVISVYFPFPKEDREFYEEISVKNQSLKAVISSYFLNYTKEELEKKGEISIKRDILSLLNEKLVLNKIPELYFEEYLFF